MGTLANVLNANRVPLSTVDLDTVHERLSERVHVDTVAVQGMIMEEYVGEWLSAADVQIVELPERVSVLDPRLQREEIYHIRLEEGSYNVRANRARPILQMDHCVAHGGRPYIVEVKKGKLNGYAERIPEVIELGKKILGSDLGLLVVVALDGIDAENARRCAQHYPVEFLEPGHDPAELLLLAGQYHKQFPPQQPRDYSQYMEPRDLKAMRRELERSFRL